MKCFVLQCIINVYLCQLHLIGDYCTISYGPTYLLLMTVCSNNPNNHRQYPEEHCIQVSYYQINQQENSAYSRTELVQLLIGSFGCNYSGTACHVKDSQTTSKQMTGLVQRPLKVTSGGLRNKVKGQTNRKLFPGCRNHYKTNQVQIMTQEMGQNHMPLSFSFFFLIYILQCSDSRLYTWYMQAYACMQILCLQ